MSAENRNDIMQRIEELAADLSTVGLSAEEAEQLVELNDAASDLDIEAELEQTELAAALLHEALIDESEFEEMPRALAGRIKMAAPVATATSEEPAPRAATPAPAPTRAPWDGGFLPWVVAAASLLLLIGSQVISEKDTTEPASGSERAELEKLATPAQELARLEAADENVLAGDWKTVKDDFAKVSGKVVWSDSEQTGVMVFEGLPMNDPKKSQYQLWIVDPGRDAKPVDGGVFDVTADGRVLVPIDAKLRVEKPTTFVITEEKPGGVVVSDGPFLVVATTS